MSFYKVNSFRLIWCEKCGQAEEPEKAEIPSIVKDTVLHCTNCGEVLTLLNAVLDGSAPLIEGTYTPYISSLQTPIRELYTKQ